jgi:hypothetical protein
LFDVFTRKTFLLIPKAFGQYYTKLKFIVPPQRLGLIPKRYNRGMSDLQKDTLATYPTDAPTPDGLRGTPSERFTEAARRVFSASREAVAQAEAEAAKTRKPRGRKAKAA